MSGHSQPLTWTAQAAQWQRWLLPDMGTAASDWINSIAYNATPIATAESYEEESQAWVRLQITALPFFAFLSTIQLGTQLLCSITLSIVGLDRSRPAITGKHGTLDLLGRSITAIFTSIYAIPFAIRDPKMYVRPKVVRREPTPTSSPPSESHIWTLQEILAKYKVITPSHIDKISELDTDYAFGFSHQSEINKHKYIWEGLQSEHIEAFIADEEAPEVALPKIDTIEKFLRPAGTTELCLRTLTLETLQQQLDGVTSKVQDLDILTLDGDHRLDQLANFPPEGILRNLKTLILRNNVVYLDAIVKLNQVFPKIACYDLRGCEVIGDPKILEMLRVDLIIITDKGSNAQAQLDKLNLKIIQGVFAQLKGTSQLIAHFDLPPGDLQLKAQSLDERSSYYHNLSPAACFVPELKFLQNIPIPEALFRSLIDRFALYFRSLTRLDLSGSNVTPAGLVKITSLKLTHLRLRACQKIYKRPEIKRARHFEAIRVETENSAEAFNLVTRTDETNVADELMFTLFSLIVSGLQFLDVSGIRDDLDAGHSKNRFTRYLMNPSTGLFGNLDNVLSKMGRTVTIAAGTTELKRFQLPMPREL